MNRILFFLILLLLGFWQVSFSQARYLSQSDTIPFTLTAANNISIQATLNGHDTLHLMLHTASNSVTLIRETSETLTGISWDTIDSTHSWGGDQTARRSSYNTLAIGSFEWDSVMIWENVHSGPETDGKFGLNLFEGKIIEFNFDYRFLVVHHQLPEVVKTYSQIPIVRENGILFLEASIEIEGDAYLNKYLLHSGFSGTVLFDDEFAQKSQLGKRLAITDSSELKDAYGNVLKTKKALLPLLKIGSDSLGQLPVGFFEGAIGRQKMSVIGGNLIKRFNWVLDIELGHFYLSPNSLMSLPYEEG